MDSADTTLIVGSAAAAATLFALAFVASRLRGSRRRSSARPWPPRVAIRDAPEGQPITIVGRVSPVKETLRAPLTGTPCLAWKVIVSQISSRGEARRSENGANVSFYVEDETGRAIVDEPVVDLLLVSRERPLSEVPGGTEERLDRFMKGHGGGPEAWFSARRGAEATLEPGEQVAVVGIGRWIVDDGSARGGGSSAYREPARTLAVTYLEDGRLVVSNDPPSR